MHLSVVLALSLNLLAEATAIPRIIPRDVGLAEEYDYIVVGGGLSGLTVANRLSETDATVLVIEGGPVLDGDAETEIVVPGWINRTGRTYTWNVTTLPNKELNNRVSQVTAARIAGGGSALNYMFFDRGSKRDYDEWAMYTGDSGWGWDSMIKYFRKAETFHPPSPEVAEKYGITWDPGAHGTDGPVQVTFPDYLWESTKIWMQAFTSIGVPYSEDGGNGKAIGHFWVPNNIDPAKMTRSYSKTAYHDKAKQRPNYHLMTEQTVTKVLFQGKTAVGVEYAASSNSTRQTVSARKEVILAAGAIHTPKLLQLSGIGDKRHLSKLNIPVLVDSPGVGNNLQDHAAGGPLFLSNLPGGAQIELATNATFRKEMLDLYFREAKGPYTAGVLGNYVAFLSLPMISTRWRQLITQAEALDDESTLRPGLDSSVLKGYKEQKRILLEGFATNDSAVDEQLGQQFASVQKPLSRGYVEITKNDPFHPVTLDWRTLSHPFDRDVMIEGVKFLRKTMRSRPMQEAARAIEISPGSRVTSDAGITTFIRRAMTPSFWHYSGTAAMGKRENGAVVDSELKVYGVERLRIVDASVQPLVPATHISNTCYAVAERAADLIKKDA